MCFAHGMPVCSGARDLRAQSAPGFPCALFTREGRRDAKLKRNRAVRMRTCVPKCDRKHRCRPGESRDPYAAADIVEMRWLPAFPQQQLTGVMGPGFRRDDSDCVATARAPLL